MQKAYNRMNKEVSMKIFIDSADLMEIKSAYNFGIINGVTTNPSLIKKAVQISSNKKMTMQAYIETILKIAKGTPVSLEVTEYSAEKMIQQGIKLFEIFNKVANNVVIKIPINPTFSQNKNKDFDGIKVIKSLSDKKIPVNCTLIFTPEQALLAAKAGATFVSPFVGRIDDLIRTKNRINYDKSDYFPKEGWIKDYKYIDDNGVLSGIDLVEQIRVIYDNFQIKTELLAASLRNVRQVREAALAGADAATIPYNVINELLYHSKTEEGMKNFTKDIVKEYEELTK